MDRYTEEYLDYIRTAALAMKCTPSVRVEERVRFARYTHEDPGNQVEGSGIADCILVGGDTIHVIDLKYGKGVQVDADHNPQLMLYALGAYDACRILYPVTKVKVTIVQPRLDKYLRMGVLPGRSLKVRGVCKAEGGARLGGERAV